MKLSSIFVLALAALVTAQDYGTEPATASKTKGLKTKTHTSGGAMETGSGIKSGNSTMDMGKGSGKGSGKGNSTMDNGSGKGGGKNNGTATATGPSRPTVTAGAAMLGAGELGGLLGSVVGLGVGVLVIL